MLIVGCCWTSFAQASKGAGSACSVAGHTESGELAVVCRHPSDGECYRLSGSSDTRSLQQGISVRMNFEPDGISVSDGKGRSVRGLKVAKWIILNSRQWPWFGPVSDMVCVAGREGND
jgi:hypothetical protein